MSDDMTPGRLAEIEAELLVAAQEYDSGDGINTVDDLSDLLAAYRELRIKSRVMVMLRDEWQKRAEKRLVERQRLGDGLEVCKCLVDKNPDDADEWVDSIQDMARAAITKVEGT